MTVTTFVLSCSIKFIGRSVSACICMPLCIYHNHEYCLIVVELVALKPTNTKLILCGSYEKENMGEGYGEGWGELAN